MKGQNTARNSRFIFDSNFTHAASVAATVSVGGTTEKTLQTKNCRDMLSFISDLAANQHEVAQIDGDISTLSTTVRNTDMSHAVQCVRTEDSYQ